MEKVLGQEGFPDGGVQQCAAQFSFLHCSVSQCGSDLEGCSAEIEAGE